ncbi:MAG: prepilin signal peptidase [Pseudomonadota bacterium]|jgi:prepilin signal peptidase PulO-like enzyme (type II secretory pathway)
METQAGLALNDPLLFPLAAAAAAWLSFFLLQRWARPELIYWLSEAEADQILARPAVWRIVAFLTAGAEVLLVSSFQGMPSLPTSLSMGVLTAALMLLAMVDLRCRLLPDRITWLLVGLGFVVALAGLSVPVGEALLGGLIGYCLPWLLALVSRRRRRSESDSESLPMGRGDFALIAGLGVWLGFSNLPLVLVIASLGMLPVAAWGLIRNRWRLSTALPFGPALAFAGLFMLPWAGFGLG